MAILFYRQWEAYGEFSNFSGHAIEVDGVTWPTVEHYFQAMKFPGHRELQDHIRQAFSPGDAKRLAHSHDARKRGDWYTVRDAVMLTAVRAKFAQHPALRDLLLSTGDEELVEHTARDSYWGDGGDGSGRNMLGHTLMAVRAELRAGGQGDP